MKILSLAVLIGILNSACAAESFDQKVEAIVRATQSTPDTGVSIVVIHKGKVILEKGYGLADREAKRPVTGKTLFAIGSTTKAFTAVTLAMAAQDGLVDLTAPVGKYLPDFRMKDPVATRDMTAIDLMTHRSGLPRHDLLWYMTPFTRENLYYRLRHLDPNAKLPFRKGFEYNNLMFMTAGVLLERVTHKPWETFLQDRVLTPLGMSSTFVTTAAAHKADDVAAPYYGIKKIPAVEIAPVAPAGSIYTNAHDMSRWLQFLLRKGKTEAGAPLLDPKAFDTLWTSYNDVELGGVKAGYGLGWFKNRLLGRTILWHGGNINGYSAYVSVLPDEETAVALLTNQNGEKSLTFEMPYRIYSELLGAPAVMDAQSAEGDELPTSLGPEAAARIGDVALPFPVDTAADALANDVVPAEYRGHYLDPGYGQISLVKAADKWFAVYYQLRFALSPAASAKLKLSADLGYTTFDVTGAFFESQTAQTTFRVPFEPSVDPIRFVKTADAR